jgi:hypothetical protein
MLHMQGFTLPDEQITNDQSFMNTTWYLAEDEANLEFAK